MAITDYTSLKAGVQAWVARTDSTFSSQFDTMLVFAEDRLYHGGGDVGDALYTPPVRAAVMETAGTLTLTGGEVGLPDSYLGLIKIYPNGGLIGTTFLPPERFAEMAANITGGDTLYHTVDAGTLKTLPALTGTVDVTYYQRFPAITATDPTGPLIAAHGSMYLAACLFEAFTFLQEGELAGAHLSRLKGLISGANRVASDLRHAGPLRQRPRMVIGG